MTMIVGHAAIQSFNQHIDPALEAELSFGYCFGYFLTEG